MSGENKILLEKQVSDWRVVDDVADEHQMTDLQKQPWTLRVQDGGYGGLFIEALAPDGTTRTISLEINDGNLHAHVGSNHSDDNHATIQIGETGIVVVPGTVPAGSTQYGVQIDQDGIAPAKGDIEPGCQTAAVPHPR